MVKLMYPNISEATNKHVQIYSYFEFSKCIRIYLIYINICILDFSFDKKKREIISRKIKTWKIYLKAI